LQHATPVVELQVCFLWINMAPAITTRICFVKN
jgi:hypothetical protein